MTMIKDKNQPTEVQVEKADYLDTAPDNERRAGVIADNEVEHELTFREVAHHHKALIGWSFDFAMSAIGW